MEKVNIILHYHITKTAAKKTKRAKSQKHLRNFGFRQMSRKSRCTWQETQTRLWSIFWHALSPSCQKNQILAIKNKSKWHQTQRKVPKEEAKKALTKSAIAVTLAISLILFWRTTASSILLKLRGYKAYLILRIYHIKFLWLLSLQDEPSIRIISFMIKQGSTRAPVSSQNPWIWTWKTSSKLIKSTTRASSCLVARA